MKNSKAPPQSSGGCFAVNCAWNTPLEWPQHHLRVPEETPSVRNQPTSEDVDLLIAKEMSNLSMKEREEAILDVHCVPGVKVENPEFVNFRLEELEHHLNIIKTAENAYSLAERINPQYVSSRKMRLMFLRAQSFVPEEAAKRMITFFEEKKRLFGIKKLVKDITLEDLGEDDMETLTSGYGQVSPLRDKARRPVIFFPSKLRKYKVPENVERATFYALMSVVESVEAQKQGVVLIYYLVDSKFAEPQVGSRLRKCLPVKCCLHICINDEEQYNRLASSILGLPRDIRMRYRMHFGSHLECQCRLLTFGVDTKGLPVNSTGAFSMKAHWEWLERRRSTEAEIAAYSVAEGNQIVRPDTHSPSRDIDDSNNAASAPRPNDVLFGRGTRVVNHPGNQYLSRMVEEYAARYDASEKLDKHCLVHFLVTKVRDSSGRFLRQQDLDDHWEEVNEKDAHQKVAYTFRNFRQTIIKRR